MNDSLRALARAALGIALALALAALSVSPVAAGMKFP